MTAVARLENTHASPCQPPKARPGSGHGGENEPARPRSRRPGDIFTDSQFIADAFSQFARDMEFLHVRIAPQRPQTNGVAERFVRTFKEWLAWHTWQGPEELTALLAEFIVYYNDRPQQGAELAGLSPNEFARRLVC